jgi:hypothetical protein
MKARIATLMIVLGVFLATTAFANEPVPASKAVSKSVANLIWEELEYPEFAIKEKLECCVLVSVIINDDGTFDVDCANCINKRLKEYVVNEIEQILSEEHAQYANQQVLIKINFDLLLV